MNEKQEHYPHKVNHNVQDLIKGEINYKMNNLWSFNETGIMVILRILSDCNSPLFIREVVTKHIGERIGDELPNLTESSNFLDTREKVANDQVVRIFAVQVLNTLTEYMILADKQSIERQFDQNYTEEDEIYPMDIIDELILDLVDSWYQYKVILQENSSIKYTRHLDDFKGTSKIIDELHHAMYRCSWEKR